MQLQLYDVCLWRQVTSTYRLKQMQLQLYVTSTYRLKKMQL